MTDEKMREALIAKAQAAHDKVALWPDTRGDKIEVGCEGYCDLLELRNLVPELIAALSTKQEAGQVSRSQTAQTLEEALEQISQLIAHARALAGPVDLPRWQRIADAALSLPAPDAGWRDAQVLKRLQIARLNGLFDASTELTMPGDSDNVPAILDAVEAALSLPAPDAGWRTMLEKAYAVLGAAHSRIHCLPRTSDTELAKRIEQMRAEIEQSRVHPLPAPPVGDGL